MTRFVAFCNHGGWGNGDVVGQLIAEGPEGWMLAAQHVSSNESFSQHDLRKHFDRLAESGDEWEWAGVVADPHVRWPPAPPADNDPEEGRDA